MQSQFTVSTDKAEKIKLESAMLSASWVAPIAYGGFEVPFEVRTVFVAEGSAIEIKGRSTKGKAPDTIKGKVFGNCFKGTLLIPEKVAPDAEIWFEAKLTKHGLKMDSNLIPARPGVGVKKICWDKKEIFRHELVKLTCEFESGVVEGEDANFVIYEHNPDSCDLKVVTIPATIKGNKAEISWEFTYLADTNQIPGEYEKQAVGKKYVNPTFYFTVVVHGIAAGKNRESGLLKFREKFLLLMHDAYWMPMKSEKFKVYFADATTKEYTSDDKGFIKEESFPPGKYFVEHVKKAS